MVAQVNATAITPVMTLKCGTKRNSLIDCLLHNIQNTWVRLLRATLFWSVITALNSAIGVEPSPSPKSTNVPFTDDEKMQLTAKVLGQEQLALRAVSPGTEKAAPKRRVLSVSIPPDTEALAPLTKTHPRVAQVIVFDYNQNNATNLLVDANSA